MDETPALTSLSYDSKSGKIVGGLATNHSPLKTTHDVKRVLDEIGRVEDLPRSLLAVVGNAVSRPLNICPLVLQPSPRKGQGGEFYQDLMNRVLIKAKEAGLQIVCFAMDGDSRMRCNIRNAMLRSNLADDLHLYINHPDMKYGAPFFTGMGPYCFNPDVYHILKNKRNFLTSQLIFGTETFSLLPLELMRLQSTWSWSP